MSEEYSLVKNTVLRFNWKYGSSEIDIRSICFELFDLFFQLPPVTSQFVLEAATFESLILSSLQGSCLNNVRNSGDTELNIISSSTCRII